MPVFSAVDLFEAINAGSLVSFVISRQQPHVSVRKIGIVSPAHIRVRVRQLSDHVAHDVGQCVAIGEHTAAAAAYLSRIFPNRCRSSSFEEVVALLPLHFVENVLPFRGPDRLPSSCSTGSSDHPRLSSGLSRFGIDNAVRLRTRAAFALIQQFGPVKRNRKAAQHSREDFRLVFLKVVDVHAEVSPGIGPESP